MNKRHYSSKLPKPIIDKDIDNLVDCFVKRVNTGYREPVSIVIDKTPPSVLVGEPDDYGFCDWMIKPCADIDWVEPLEQKLGCRFPIAYRSLTSRYIFPGFDAGGIFFFGNTPEGTDYWELRERIFLDPGIRDTLLPRGYIEFGKRDQTIYDPICFDMNRKSMTDCPIVQIEHEYAFDGIIEIVCQVAPSFRELLETVVDNE
ncbi:MAG: SMI1/KNR4 family protein [Armatimonadota bacterium]